MRFFKFMMLVILVSVAVFLATGRVQIRHNYDDGTKRAVFLLLPGYDEVSKNVGREDPMFRVHVAEGGRFELEDITQDSWVTVEEATDRHPYRISPWF